MRSECVETQVTVAAADLRLQLLILAETSARNSRWLCCKVGLKNIKIVHYLKKKTEEEPCKLNEVSNAEFNWFGLLSVQCFLQLKYSGPLG